MLSNTKYLEWFASNHNCIQDENDYSTIIRYIHGGSEETIGAITTETQQGEIFRDMQHAIITLIKKRGWGYQIAVPSRGFPKTHATISWKNKKGGLKFAHAMDKETELEALMLAYKEAWEKNQ